MVLAFPSVFVALVAVAQVWFAQVVFAPVSAPSDVVVFGARVFVSPLASFAVHQAFAVPA